jgi:hypothetical protein
MKLLRRKSSAPSPGIAARCQRRRTRSGRIAHLWHPDLGPLCPFGEAAGVLVADPLMPLCDMCRAAAGLPKLPKAAA